MSFFTVDNYGSFGDDNTSDEDEDDGNDEEYYESGAPLVTFSDPDSDSYYPEFGVPNVGSLIFSMHRILRNMT